MRTRPRWWPSNSRSLWHGGSIGAGICIILLMAVYILYRHGQTEQEIVANLLSKDPTGSFDFHGLPTFANSLKARLGIPLPVTDVDLARSASHRRRSSQPSRALPAE